MRFVLRIVDAWETGPEDPRRPSSFNVRLQLVEEQGGVVDEDVFRWAKGRGSADEPPPGWKPGHAGPQETNAFTYRELVEIAARYFLRRQAEAGHVAFPWPPEHPPVGWKPSRFFVQHGGADTEFPLARRLAAMRGAMLVVEVPALTGHLRWLPPAAGDVVTISTNFDGTASFGDLIYSCNDTATTVFVGVEVTPSVYLDRVYARFPLTSLPSGADVVGVDLRVNVAGVVGAPLVDVQAYNQNGQADPQADVCSTRHSRCADDPTPYLNNITDFQTTGVKTLTLPGAAPDVMAAKTAVNRFTIAFNEDNTSQTGSNYARLTTLEAGTGNEAKLILSYSVLGPFNVVWY